ncbi:MAG: DUF4388 domain-containing protein [Myxococcota bacterium]
MNEGLSGQFSPTVYLQLLRAIHLSTISGTLEINSGRSERKIQFVDGQIIGYQSNLADDALYQTVQEEFQINARSMRLHMQQLKSEESLAESLVESEIITGDELKAHMNFRIRRGLSSVMGLKTGEWRFQSLGWLNRAVVSEDLAPEVSAFVPLWNGLLDKITDAEVTKLVPLDPTQTFKMDPDGQAIISQFELSEAVQELLNSGEPTDLEKLVAADPEQPARIFKLVLFLYHYGVLDCGNEHSSIISDLQSLQPIERIFESESIDDSSDGNKRRSSRLRRLREKKRGPQKSTSESSKAKDSKTEKQSLSDWIIQEHETRMGANFYEFAGVSENETYSLIDKKIKRLLIKWVKAGKSSEIKGETAEKCAKLIKVMKMVHKVLTNPERRTKYDQALKLGSAPMAGIHVKLDKVEEEAPESNSIIPVAIQGMIEKGRYADALPVLKKLRFDNPSSVEVLTKLGWALWNVERNSEGAREWLQMALTFDPQLMEAVEYLSQIAIEENELEHAQLYLRRCLQLDPTHLWAKDKLEEVNRALS